MRNLRALAALALFVFAVAAIRPSVPSLRATQRACAMDEDTGTQRAPASSSQSMPDEEESRGDAQDDLLTLHEVPEPAGASCVSHDFEHLIVLPVPPSYPPLFPPDGLSA